LHTVDHSCLHTVKERGQQRRLVGREAGRFVETSIFSTRTLDEIAGQGRWRYQFTITGATFAPLIHVAADWQLVENHYADRPLRHELATGRALGATVADALHTLVAQIRAAVAIEDAFDEL
jgi:hypothetical protein